MLASNRAKIAQPAERGTDGGRMLRHHVGRYLTLVLVCAIGVLGGCLVKDPNFCCDTEERCAASGVHDELILCKAGLACGENNACITAECETALECNSPDAPTCRLGFCVPGCSVDGDCQGIAGSPYCAADNVCVGCTSNAQCPSDMEICNTESRSCSRCTADSECASGVCIDAEGVCAAADSLIYVSNSQFANDAGDCPKTAPCRSISFAFSRVTSTRRVVRLVAGTHATGSNPLAIPQGVIIDGDDAVIQSTASPVFSVQSSNVVIGGVGTLGAATLLDVKVGGTVQFAAATLDRATMTVSGGSLDISDVEMQQGGVTCIDGTVTISRVTFERAPVQATNCRLTINASRLGPDFSSVMAEQGSLVLIENNIFSTVDSPELVRFYSISPQSAFRFNTVLRTSEATATVGVIFCSLSSLEITSNIFAINSTRIGSSGCSVHHSLLDLAVQDVVGEGNKIADSALFFVDRVAGDYRLPSTSPAIGLGQVGLVTVDLRGSPRPMPVGSQPDVGAYEAP